MFEKQLGMLLYRVVLLLHEKIDVGLLPTNVSRMTGSQPRTGRSPLGNTVLSLLDTVLDTGALWFAFVCGLFQFCVCVW